MKTRHGVKRAAAGVTVAGLMALIVTGAALGQPAEPVEPQHPGQADWDAGAAFYAEENYTEAVPFLRRACQAEPNEARYYRGLARALHFGGQLDEAVLIYDLYLTHFGEFARAEPSRRNRESAVRAERERANTQRANSAIAPGTPSDQVAALQAFQRRLESGPFMTDQSTGAWSLYQALLRTGYVHPDLAGIQARLAEGILGETQAMLWPAEDSPIPVQTLRTWTQVDARYQTVASLGMPISGDVEVEARLAAAQGMVDLINANYTEAVTRFTRAVSLDADLAAAHWGLLLARHRLAERGVAVTAPSPELVSARVLGDLEALVAVQSPQHQRLIPLLHAMLQADAGDTDAAARNLIEVLVPGAPRGPRVPAPPRPPAPAVPASPPAGGAPGAPTL